MFDDLRVLLDTQAFLELSVYGLENVSAAIRRVVEDEETDILLSLISVTEIAIKAAIGKLSFGAEQVSQGIKLLPRVEGHHDPFDRDADRDGAGRERAAGVVRQAIQTVQRSEGDPLMDLSCPRCGKP
jgi:hypothetical protein